MEKPDDIPQDIWDAADAALPPLDGTRYASAHVLVARAILAERERCARVADNTSAEYRAASSLCGYREDRRAFDDRASGAAVVARNIRAGT